MNDNKSKKETRSGAGTPERASEKVLSAGQNTLSVEDNTTETKRRQIGRVYESLPSGKENAIPGRELANLLGISDLRNLTAQIERERRAKLPICAAQGSDGAGYYKAATPEELEEYIRTLGSRAYNLRRTIERLEDTLADWQGQGSVWGDSDE